MDCARIEPLLVDFHFGYVGRGDAPHPDYEAVAAHLHACPACLSSYLALKRDVDYGAADPARPGPERRESLRAAVAAEFRPSIFNRIGGFLAAPTPRYQLAGALALGLLVAAFGVLHPVHGPGGAQTGVLATQLPGPSQPGPGLTAAPSEAPHLILTEETYELSRPRRNRMVDTARPMPASLTFY